MFCHEQKHSALPLVLAGPALSKFTCFPIAICTGINLFYMKTANSLRTLLSVQAYSRWSWRGTERTKTRWLHNSEMVTRGWTWGNLRSLPALFLTFSRDKILFPACGKISQSHFAFLLFYLKQKQQPDLISRDCIRIYVPINQLSIKIFSY